MLRRLWHWFRHTDEYLKDWSVKMYDGQTTVDISDEIAILDADDSTFRTMLMKLTPKDSVKVEWLEDELFPYVTGARPGDFHRVDFDWTFPSTPLIAYDEDRLWEMQNRRMDGLALFVNYEPTTFERFTMECEDRGATPTHYW